MTSKSSFLYEYVTGRTCTVGRLQMLRIWGTGGWGIVVSQYLLAASCDTSRGS